MKGTNKILAYIEMEAAAECERISRVATGECDRIRVDYDRQQQEEYWKCINAGSKETEHRQEQLKNLAEMEARKKLLSTQQEMVDEAFAHAAKILLELPEREYAKLLKRLGKSANCSANEVVESYRNELSLKIASALFD